MTRKFDLDAAKRGEPILLDGKPATFVAHLPEASPNQRLVVLAKDGNVFTMYDDGVSLFDNISHLTMAPRKQQLWGRAFLNYSNSICMRTAYKPDSVEFHAGDLRVRWLDPEPWLIREYEVDDE